jgi:hypothetical protein
MRSPIAAPSCSTSDHGGRGSSGTSRTVQQVAQAMQAAKGMSLVCVKSAPLQAPVSISRPTAHSAVVSLISMRAVR